MTNEESRSAAASVLIAILAGTYILIMFTTHDENVLKILACALGVSHFYRCLWLSEGMKVFDIVMGAIWMFLFFGLGASQ